MHMHVFLVHCLPRALLFMRYKPFCVLSVLSTDPFLMVTPILSDLHTLIVALVLISMGVTY